MKSKMVMAGLAGLAIAAAANAATITVTPVISAMYDSAFAPVPINTINPGAPRVIQVDYMMQVSGANFGNVAINTVMQAAAPNALAAYAPDSSTVDSNGAIPGGVVPKWSVNQDAGASTTDLQNVIVSIAGGVTSTVDPRLTLGQSGAVYMGQSFIDWDGVSLGSISLDVTGWSGNVGGVLTTLDLGTNPAVETTIPLGVPEPASLGLLALGGLLMARRRA